MVAYRNALKELFALFIIIFLTFTAFFQTFHLLFFDKVFHYSTIIKSILTFFSIQVAERGASGASAGAGDGGAISFKC